LLPAHDPGWAEVVTVRREIEQCLTRGALRSGTAAFIDYWSGAGSFAQMSAERQAALTPLLPKAALDFRSTAGTPLHAAALDRLTMPVMLMHGQSGPLSARRVTGRLHALLPRARLVAVAGGHMAPLTHPALVNPLIADFIAAADTTVQGAQPQPEAMAG
jgi:pimeloyl-ACP methyl ester carboxylesterase